jgi:hypothetical protein
MTASVRERAAYHEASHVAACLCLGIAFHYASIDGRPHLLRGHYRQQHDLGVECLAVMSMAGSVGEEYFCGEITDGGDRIDLEMARGYLAQRFGPLRIGVEFERARAAARRLVIDQKQRIQRIAAALLDRGSLSNEDISAIISC